MVKFSIIIPCYHSEQFVGKAIKSVQEQSFKDYELIVTCEKKDEKTIDAIKACGVTPILGDYGSVGYSRNDGMDHAKGEYILFLDSDDWYLHSECLAMLDKFTIYQVDVLTFAFIFGIYGYTSTSGNNGAMYPNVWSRVWRRSFLEKNNIRFTDAEFEEDVEFTTKAFECHPAHRVTDIPFIYYTYPREGSQMYEFERRNSSQKQKDED